MKVLLTGSTGMVGKNLISNLNASKYSLLTPNRKELNLFDKTIILNWLKNHEIDLIIHSAGLVGGIQANINDPCGFLFQNLTIGLNLIDVAYNLGIKNFINLGSSCMYPKNISTSIEESQLLSGKLEETNEGYAIAKISIAKYCEYITKSNKDFNYKTLIPCNIYGSYDDFSLIKSHMIPGVISRMYQAKKENAPFIEIWGDGIARREFMYAQDLAEAIWFCVEKIKNIPNYMNIGIGEDFSILDYYSVIAKVIGYDGNFKLDKTKPTGMKRKLISSTKINKLGWRPKFSLYEGIDLTYKYFIKEIIK